MLFYYKQSDLFAEAPQDRGARTPVNEGERGLRLTVLLRYRFPELVPSCQEMQPLIPEMWTLQTLVIGNLVALNCKV